MFFSRTLLVTSLVASALASTIPILAGRQNLAQVITKCKNSKQVALTFDDGPYNYIQDISNKLVAAGAKRTFFFNGNNYQCVYSKDNVKRLKAVYAAGHQVASHTWGHLNLAQQSFDKVHDEMWKVEQALQRIVGVTPAFMRPPFGSYNNNVRTVAYQRKQTIVNWDFDSGDSGGKTAKQSKDMYKAAFDKNPTNMLALNHETYATTANDVLPYVLNLIKSKGYKMVTVAECLGMQPYTKVAAPQTGSWSC